VPDRLAGLDVEDVRAGGVDRERQRGGQLEDLALLP